MLILSGLGGRRWFGYIGNSVVYHILSSAAIVFEYWFCLGLTVGGGSVLYGSQLYRTFHDGWHPFLNVDLVPALCFPFKQAEIEVVREG